MREIFLAGGCFWGVQKYFDLIFGVIKTEVGYANGKNAVTNYKKLDITDHTETVKIIYNPHVLPLEKLLNYYFEIIDPTSINKQGKDIGRQYRTGIYYTDKNDVPIIIKALEKLQRNYPNKIVVEVEALKNYIKAEKYHQDFLKSNPFSYCHIPSNKFKEIKIKQLDNISYRVMKYKETERAYHNEYYNNYLSGIYVDKETNRPLFLSSDKCERGYGWPTFNKTSFNGELEINLELKNLKLRNEVISKAGRNHLGYLFYEKEGKLYIINSGSLRFIPLKNMEKEGFGAYIKLINK